mmetsp:Transcript_9699/g.17069  ORF Transcript_9699/g.17069 Transcript_9699/m.17069 type:complete len:80 (+) Transcript_9699:163-402(+)
MSQLFQKIAQYLANEIVTKRLANSQTFMNAAHKTHQQVQNSKKMVQDGVPVAKEQSQSLLGFLAEVRSELAKQATGNKK